ncbi:circadian clock protein KaiA [Stenomitos frigidus ULC18]|uniref:Circadian clock oscillator protein KaiA n=1 Tax=Stenomitos frigidus ULC18 TaxID=2107698 RepID=A0A2T1E4R5_9CYAN|nr:circadian clock protein KaiA [Stenomitos frigidus ULC18]
MTQSLSQRLDHDRHAVTLMTSGNDFFAFVEQEKQRLDCLILHGTPALLQFAHRLHGQATLLPAVVITAAASPDAEHASESSQTVSLETAIVAQAIDHLGLEFAYHTAEVWITTEQFNTIGDSIERAINQFLHLSPTCRLSNTLSTVDLATNMTAQNFLMLQQRRLSDKLKERLGYLSVYYKRNPRNFFRYMPAAQREETLEQLRSEYREIVLHYFGEDSTLNQLIDEFVNSAFFADIATSQVVEIHMDLMDEFAKQLKLEGRSDDILLDYRLTLIDTIAHLCEMYRRSVPREA